MACAQARKNERMYYIIKGLIYPFYAFALFMNQFWLG
ncbi:MAG: hypothetical protein H6Q38_3242 [Chloroflexi bacterium]|nr:hypothetical protein [Chloroflexota bacterium]